MRLVAFALAFFVFTSSAQAQVLGCYVDSATRAAHGDPKCADTSIECDTSDHTSNIERYGRTVAGMCLKANGARAVSSISDAQIAYLQAGLEYQIDLTKRIRALCGATCEAVK